MQEDGKQVFLGRQPMINPWHCLIDNAVDGLLAQQDIQLLEQGAGCRSRHLVGHHQTAIRKSLMRIQRIAHNIGRQQRIKVSLAVEHERMVLKAVAMVVHVVAEEKKRAVLRLCYKVIPCCLVSLGISSDFKHAPSRIS